MKKNQDKLSHLLRSFAWHELSESDRQWVSTLVSGETEYEALRYAELELLRHFAGSEIQPDEQLLHDLKQRINPLKPVQTRSLPYYSMGMAAALLIAFGWWMGLQWNQKPQTIMPVASRVDTVFITKQPDTVWRDRVVYQKIVVASADSSRMQPVVQGSLPETRRGISMKEKEELEKLLVSGGF
ncbi:MAG TPA: hypothetical protein PLX35_14305 [Cyclobacteriaceae bacterium]|nr:hypothetical protein [Cyclobacteriaceae bacterium]